MADLLTNAQLVLADRVVTGSIRLDGAQIAAVEPEATLAVPGEDLEGDFLLPGLIDLHTDNIERHFRPRPRVTWPFPIGSVLTHDWELLGAGITTVVDSLALGDYDGDGARAAMLDGAISSLKAARDAGLLKAEHYLHLRCELADPGVLEFARGRLADPTVRLISLMDHTPGQRQWRNLDIYREYYRKKHARVWNDEEFAAHLEVCRNNQQTHTPRSRDAILAEAALHGLPLASHDDTTVEDVDQSHTYGVGICEFPTTLEAAQRAHDHGMKNVMGAPNVVLGKSHSGNVSAIELAHAGLVDILSSDYVPSSMLQAIFKLAGMGFDLAKVVAMGSLAPAQALRFDDRGSIAPSLRADLLRVRVVDGLPVIRNIWIGGRRIL
ncbi:alpha-D-ribose 1-methylphosphonate 5-triphosphate diphosphatase [Sphingomonas sp. TX0543]|jgi:alpha-D-ribose 1-methylphosphonate 5-triphosphate diphosphatase|uniref:alpha-D-ribose 1-methylphosphonate 5-triphosphate diphosphatase n=2 Tax=Sphingomonadales TaxID=204457 RepID=UPI000F5E5839|nr:MULTISPECIES: alpha-D-ribose 1-methylphosphonate 5-triphosphate diphosphatase [Sphingomonadaceae]MBI0533282.1 alpha-D-ribose 1-methylphosphonate 5-triphosphate diphosphatase [Sphingomonas sp. TX0522]RQW37001.1 alpha-D-ribose 1-methylphosphonate 5-triphosphate diphosphatase [Novosphingobium sp. LASN5T]RUN74587.1 alpha-D-ribose 1-methylphosphonate 5-triphosphate diphosphatase [Sphingomonas sp. TF3]